MHTPMNTLEGEGRHVRGLRKALAAAALATTLLAPLALSACNTAKGVGKDVEAAGEGLQEVSDDTKDAIKN